MQVAPPVFREDTAYQITLTAHTQAVESAIRTMHTHLQEALTLEDLASVACLSPFHFARVFRHLIGIPPGEFLTALRFQTARHLLLTTSLSVTDICFEVGYTSLGSFTSRFTHLVGLSPRLLRQRARGYEPLLEKPGERPPTASAYPLKKHTLAGHISGPATFRGTIYLGLFTSPTPQGRPAHCTRLHAPGAYLLAGITDGIYYLRAAAFPISAELHSALLPGEKLLLGRSATPLVMRHGQVIGDPNLILRPPRLTDLPLVMGLPLL